MSDTKFERNAGILMPVSSLPSPYGIGTFGKDAYDFVTFVKECNHKYWQVLPLGPTTYGDSPYQSYSAFAGNPYFVDLDMLIEAGFLLKSEVISRDWGDGIVPVNVSTRKGDVVVDKDEQPFNANIEKIPTLRPAFAKDGTITAANASSISDGASALVLTSAENAANKGLRPLAKIVAYATNSQHPSEFTIAPVAAIQKVLDKAGWQVADVDLWEINEAFAMVTMCPIDEFKLDPEKVNINGGACALGHPVGSTGSRIILTLIHALKRTGGKRGVAALCIGGGEATAVAIELL